ncbi:hypothetical protein EAG_09354 [Camponotus floridanus]|uniref:Uncharacterized protein n=1 Tax=Camponotus floridanus TaxID=104421 RepID=E2B0P3_CAMFO|nr:hypothetical protein EAG_09354 [Camponotus floridanus]
MRREREDEEEEKEEGRGKENAEEDEAEVEKEDQESGRAQAPVRSMPVSRIEDPDSAPGTASLLDRIRGRVTDIHPARDPSSGQATSDRRSFDRPADVSAAARRTGGVRRRRRGGGRGGGGGGRGGSGSAGAAGGGGGGAGGRPTDVQQVKRPPPSTSLSPPASSSRCDMDILAVACALVATALYCNTLQAGFVYDDRNDSEIPTAVELKKIEIREYAYRPVASPSVGGCYGEGWNIINPEFASVTEANGQLPG